MVSFRTIKRGGRAITRLQSDVASCKRRYGECHTAGSTGGHAFHGVHEVSREDGRRLVDGLHKLGVALSDAQDVDDLSGFFGLNSDAAQRLGSERKTGPRIQTTIETRAELSA